MPPIIEILPNKTALIDRAKAWMIEKIEAAIATRGRCHIALSGGSTPGPLYAALAQSNLPWQQLYIYWGDERYVAASHPDSNARMARSLWLDQVPIPAAQIFSVPTEVAPPAAAAQQYEDSLRQSFEIDANREPPNPADPLSHLPRFDIILLGMGDDGHTASLFPHTAALSEQQRWVTVGQKGDQPRITFTVPLINQAHHVLFLVAGADKQAALSQVFSPTGDSLSYPSRLIQPQGELYWLLDADAAANLPTAS